MPGMLFMPTNRLLIATVSVVTGSVVSGYPVENLNDWSPAHQLRVTPSLGAVVIQFDLNTSPATTTDPSYLIGALGLKNHNLDGCDITVKSNTAASYAGATTRLSTFTLQASMQNPDALYKFSSPYADRYWYLAISGAPNPVKLGVVGMGPVFDFGYPEGGHEETYAPQSDVLRSALGYPMQAELRDPVTGRTFTFTDPDQIGATAMYNRTRGAGAYYAYSVFLRHMRQRFDRSIAAGGVVNTGVSAGAGIPIFYHLGDQNGLSSAGRPAFYGRVTARPRVNSELQYTDLAITVEDEDPLGIDIVPSTY